MILLQQERAPSLSALSKPWKQPPRELPQETLPSSISHGTPSYFFSVQENTARALPTLPRTPSGLSTSNYSLDSSPTMLQRRPTPCLLRPTLSASYSQPRRTALRENKLDMAAPATPKGVQWRPCIAEWNTFYAMAPPVKRLSQVSRRPSSGNRTEGTTLFPPSDPLS